jgi:hypothetical protein
MTSHKHINKKDIIIIDFEGFIGKPPSFVGVWDNGTYTIIILDKNMIGVTDQKNVVFMDLQSFLEETASFCRKENKKLIGYSNKELEVFKEFGVDISDIYYNPIKNLKKWFYKKQYKLPKPFALNDVLKVLEYPKYRYFGDKQTTQRIKHVTTQLIRSNQNFQDLTPVAKSKWTKLQKYNNQDVVGLLWTLEHSQLVA